MSHPVIAALIEPRLNSPEDSTALLALYSERIFDLGRPSAYGYLLERRLEILAVMRNDLARAEFVLRGWRVAPAVDWERWAEQLNLDNSEQDQLRSLALDVLVHVLEESAHLTTTEAINAAAAHVHLLAPNFDHSLDQTARTLLGTAAENALGEAWGDSEEAMLLQASRHELIRAVGRIVPSAAAELTEQRTIDAVWPIDNDEVGVNLIVLRAWQLMAEDLKDEAYERILEALPDFDRDTQPLEFAEVMASRCVIMAAGPYGGGRTFVKARLDDMGALRRIEGDYNTPIRTAAAACTNLSPNSIQLRRLLAYVGRGPSKETKDSVRRWSAAHGKGPTATLIKDMMRFPMAAWWMPTFREYDYDEAPILRRLEEVLFDGDNSVGDRTQFAAALQALGLRTKNGPTKVAKMVVKLLKPARKDHHRNDLPVALILCGCIGPEQHKQHSQISKALIAYSKKWNHRFNAAENEAILEAGITLDEEYLNTKAQKGIQETAEEIARRAGKWAISRLSPFS